MKAAGEPVDRETYDLISNSLSHPIRRKILRLLSESGRLNFTDLCNSVGVDGSHLSYHLNQLGELLTKHEDGSYGLSYLGTLSVSLMQDVEESSSKRARETPTSPRFEKPAYELSVGEIVSSSVRLYLSKPLELLLPFIVITAVSEIILHLFLLPPMTGLLVWSGAAFELTISLRGLSTFDYLAQTLFLDVVVIGPFSAVANGFAVKFTSEILNGGNPGLGDSTAFAMSRLLPLYFARTIAWILEVTGTILFVAPGLILSIVLFLLEPVIIIERTHPLEALGRSRSLVDRKWTKTLGVSLLFAGLLIALSFPFLLLGAATRALFEPFVGLLSAFMISLLLPLIPISQTYLYYSMIVKGKMRESVDPNLERNEDDGLIPDGSQQSS